MTISDAYKQTLLDLHVTKPRWGKSAAKYGGPSVTGELLRSPSIVTVLDYGAGSCGLEAYVRKVLPERKLEWTNYDPGIPALESKPAGQYDMVITCDVMEHIERHHVESTIQELGRLTGQVLYNNISCQLTNKQFLDGPFKGKDIHLSVHSAARWREMFFGMQGMSLLEWHAYERRVKKSTGNPRGLHSRCLMIHERIKAL